MNVRNDRPRSAISAVLGYWDWQALKDEISGTLLNGGNKGLWVDKDMVRFCGHPAIVRKQIHEITTRTEERWPR